ncbi:hypothetical protein Nepgr_013029 [Nepenthes gracilis]|uniref:Uncharacterized protein n=1 Tax=Nepenthes gracilis TaxID=150966 RepID=A0AAD3XNL9_NEPGR|nr:hypothetical protein Nepgr_013029 [Nepenthes gracilis]
MMLISAVKVLGERALMFDCGSIEFELWKSGFFTCNEQKSKQHVDLPFLITTSASLWNRLLHVEVTGTSFTEEAQQCSVVNRNDSMNILISFILFCKKIVFVV